MLMTVKGEMGEEVGRKMSSKKVMIVHLFLFWSVCGVYTMFQSDDDMWSDIMRRSEEEKTF